MQYMQGFSLLDYYDCGIKIIFVLLFTIDLHGKFVYHIVTSAIVTFTGAGHICDAI